MKICLLICLFLFTGFAQAGSWEDRRSELSKVALFEKFRVFYSLEGADALPTERKKDSNNDGIPDFIEDVGNRLVNADKFFSREVGLIPPLKSKRYIGNAHFVDVNILDFSKNKMGPKNGVAYDGTPKFNRSRTGQVSTKVLAIDLSRSVRLGTNSVEHELFHLYQNGYTFFKNRWYTEGTARWSELIMKDRVGKGSTLPQSSIDKKKLFKKSYDANKFWNEVIRTVDKKNNGKHFIKALLEELDKADNVVAHQRGLSNTHWKEKEQRSEKNNIFIWDATLKAIQRSTNILQPQIKTLYEI